MWPGLDDLGCGHRPEPPCGTWNAAVQFRLQKQEERSRDQASQDAQTRAASVQAKARSQSAAIDERGAGDPEAAGGLWAAESTGSTGRGAWCTGADAQPAAPDGGGCAALDAGADAAVGRMDGARCHDDELAVRADAARRGGAERWEAGRRWTIQGRRRKAAGLSARTDLVQGPNSQQT